MAEKYRQPLQRMPYGMEGNKEKKSRSYVYMYDVLYVRTMYRKFDNRYLIFRYVLFDMYYRKHRYRHIGTAVDTVSNTAAMLSMQQYDIYDTWFVIKAGRPGGPVVTLERYY